jgi:thioredoxin 1
MGETMKKILFLAVFMTLLAQAEFCRASEVDNVLSKANKDGKIVMLELGSVGCIPCEQMKPVMEKLRKYYGGQLEVFFVDVRKYREAAGRYGIYTIPTQVFIDKKGKEFSRHIGYFPYEEIVPVLKKAGL